jgi:hypothetical protein
MDGARAGQIAASLRRSAVARRAMADTVRWPEHQSEARCPASHVADRLREASAVALRAMA